MGYVPVTDLAAGLIESARYVYDPKSLFNFISAAVILLVAVLICRWERGSRVSLHFLGVSGLFVLWALGRGVMRLLGDPSLLLLVSRYVYVLIAAAIPLLYQFIMLLLRMERRRALIIRLNWAVGVPLMVAALATPWVVSGTYAYSWGLEPRHGVLGHALLAWILLLMTLAAHDMQVTFRRTPRGSVERQRVGWFAGATLVLYFGIVDFFTASGLAIYPFSFGPVMGFSALAAYATWRYGLVEVSAQLAADQIAQMTQGALLVLDRDGVVHFVNERAVQMLGVERERLLGQPAHRWVGEAFQVESLAVLSRLESPCPEKEIPYPAADGRTQDLALSVSSVHDRHRREVAYVCLLRDVTEQKRLEQERRSDLFRDPLTGLANRAMFLELLDTALERTRQSPQYRFAVCFLGLDRLHVVNEDLGYAAGDRVIRETAARLRQTVRAQDMVARLGGDEFGVLLDDMSDPAQLSQLVAQLNEAVRAPLRHGDHNLYLHASFGVATGDPEYANGTDVLRHASVALYRAKEDGGGATHFVTPGERHAQRTRLEADLRRALEHDELQVHYQPVVDLYDRRVVGFEALVRWQHPERGLLLPGEFIEFAEEVGLMVDIDRRVLDRVCADLSLMQRECGDRRLSVSVNLTDGELLDPALPERVQERIQRHGLDAAALRLELLERVGHIEPVRETLRRLQALGVGLYIDDFGTGYSALARLHELPVTALKIDREFVRGIAVGGGAKIISTIILLGRSLGLDVIAEGAATAEEVLRLRDLGCRRVQGFFFSHAVPRDEALVLVTRPDPFAEQFVALEAAPARAHVRRSNL